MPITLKPIAPQRAGTFALRPLGASDEADDDDADRDEHEMTVEDGVERVRTAFQERAKQEADRFRIATDSEFWICVGFQTREQKDEFLRAIKHDVDADGDKYVDGVLLAREIGVTLTSPAPEWREPRMKPKLSALALPLLPRR